MESARDGLSNSVELAELLDRLVDHHQHGEPIDWLREIERHPQFADRLRSLAPMLELLGQCHQPALSSGDSKQAVGSGGLVPGTQLGDFRIVRLVARGGMGLVFEAQQLSLSRRVALKVLPASGLWDERLRQRFRHEAQAAAQLHHPHIVPVYAVGTDQGVDYYAMQLVNGPTLAAVISGWNAPPLNGTAARDGDATDDCGQSATPRQLPVVCQEVPEELPAQPTADGMMDEPVDRVPRQATSEGRRSWRVERYRLAVSWIIAAAEAIEHAHQQGILHRDLKPANLMLDRSSWLWVTDFGLARSRHEISNTATGELVGTLRYMSPEQASGSKFLDERTDVYALGATLYELLVLAPAFPQDNSPELLQSVVQGALAVPRRIDPSLPRDLETIVMKAMSTQAADRYRSAAELGEDLTRWLEDRPILARRPGTLQQASRWVSRNPAITMLIAAVGLLAAVLAVGGTWYQSRLASRDMEVRQKEAALRAEQYATLRTQSLQLTFDRPPEWTQRALDSLRRAAEVAPQGRDLGELRSAAVNLLAAPDIVQVATLPHQNVVHCLKFNARGDRLAVGYNLMPGEVPVEIWDPGRAELVETLRFPADSDYVTTRGVQGDGVRSLEFRRDGRFLAAATRSGWVHLWDMTDPQRPRMSWKVDESPILGVRFAPKGEQLVIASQSGQLSAWSVPDHRLMRQRKFDGELRDIALSTNGTLLCAIDDRSAAVRWADFSDVPLQYSGVGLAVAGGSGARFSIWGADGGRVLMLDTSGQISREFCHRTEKSAHTGSVQSVAYSNDGSLIASGCSDHVLNVWNASTGELVRRLDLGTNGRISGEFSAGNLLAVTVDRETRIYRINGAHLRQHFGLGATPVMNFGTNMRYSQVVTMHTKDVDETAWGVRHWDSKGTWYPTLRLGSKPDLDVLLSISRHRMAVSSNRQERIDVFEDRKSVMSFGVRDTRAIRYDPVAQELWAACVPPEEEQRRRIGGVRGWSLTTGEVVGKWLNMQAEADKGVTDVETLDVGRRYVVAGSNDGTVIVFQRQPFQLLYQRPLGIGRVRSVAISPDDRVVLASGDSGQMALVNTSDGQRIGTVSGDGDPIESIAVSRVGSRVATGSVHGGIQIWALEGTDLTPQYQLPRQSGPIVSCQFAGRSLTLITLARNDNSVQRWNLSAIEGELERLGMAVVDGATR